MINFHLMVEIGIYRAPARCYIPRVNIYMQQISPSGLDSAKDGET